MEHYEFALLLLSAVVSACLEVFAKLSYWPAALIGSTIVLGSSAYVGLKFSTYFDGVKEAKSNKKTLEKDLIYNNEKHQDLLKKIEILKNLDLNESSDYLSLKNHQDKKSFNEQRYNPQDNLRTVKSAIDELKCKPFKNKNVKDHYMGE